MKKIFSILLLSFFFCKSYGQVITAQKIFGSAYPVGSTLVQPAFDGGYFFCGSVTDSSSSGDILLVKTDHDLNIAWTYLYKGNGNISPIDMKVSGSNDILITASVDLNAGNTDILLADINYGGAVKWGKMYGGAAFEFHCAPVIDIG